MQDAFNAQITAELYSSNLYLEMAFWFRKEGWKGFANWMFDHSNEEKEHALKMADLYAPQFSVADKTATSLNTITAIIDYSKKAFTQNLDILRSYATSLGIKKYTISWRCDDANVTTREGFVVTAE